ncbi:hypothetical protein LTR53_006828 [Teratosphaeriaceae sp. CCFEE 6253]|nr:hypothetical protein LTR53_006828 [Teratosphaeriaceae sp. CCFEE 6253]
MPLFTEGTGAPTDESLRPLTGSGVTTTQGKDHIRIRNRRKRYLDLHPEYIDGSNLELADPLLYDRLIRRFQTADEREREGRERGYTGNLEADLVRAEAKLEALQHPDPNNPVAYRRAADGSIVGVEGGGEGVVQSRAEGRARWEDSMRLRFLRGDDEDFEYATVDENDEYDDRGEEDRVQLDEYLAKENQEFVGEGLPRGETGEQDF